MSGVEMAPCYISPRPTTHTQLKGFVYGFTQNIRYYNNFSKDVRLALRSGLSVELPTASDPRNAREFVVIVEFEFNHDVYERLQYQLHTHEADRNPCLAMIRDNLIKDGLGKYSKHVSRIEFAVTESDFIDKGKALYLQELDIAIAYKQSNIIHPYSQDGSMYNVLIEHRDTEFSYRFEYVKESGDDRPLFTRVAGQIVQIDPKISNVVPPGLYVTAVNVKSSISGEPVHANLRIDPDDVDELKSRGFYRTYIEASDGPDLELSQKLELTRSQTELAKTNMAVEQLKQTMEIERLEHKRLLALKEAELKEATLVRERLNAALEDKLTEEQAQRKLAHAERHDELEARSAYRKEQTEVIKYIPSFILGIGAAFIALKSIIK